MSNTYMFDASFTYATRSAVDLPGAHGYESVEAFLDAVFDHLVDDLGMADVNIILDEGDQRFTVSLSVDGASELDVDQVSTTGLSAIRTAIHAKDGMTPQWEASFQRMSTELTRC